MAYPIVKVKTVDDYMLHGLFSPVTSSKKTVIHIHGTGGNFFWNEFYKNVSAAVNQVGFSYLSTNNRGSGIYELENGAQPRGISLELFEDCLKDIDVWIEFAKNQGATSIILEGHSFGIGKITYYMAKGKYRNLVEGIIYLGSNGVFQTQEHYLKKLCIDPNIYLTEAKQLIEKGKGTEILTDRTALAGYYPVSAQTYINFFSPGSNVFKSTQMAKKREGGYRSEIAIPMLWIIGDDPQKEYLFIPFSEAFALVKSENTQVEIHQLKNCDHGFYGHERETAEIISNFLSQLSPQ